MQTIFPVISGEEISHIGECSEVFYVKFSIMGARNNTEVLRKATSSCLQHKKNQQATIFFLSEIKFLPIKIIKFDYVTQILVEEIAQHGGKNQQPHMTSCPINFKYCLENTTLNKC